MHSTIPNALHAILDCIDHLASRVEHLERSAGHGRDDLTEAVEATGSRIEKARRTVEQVRSETAQSKSSA